MTGLRSWAANRWLDVLFWLTTHARWVLRLLKPLILFVAWNSSQKIRASTLANARWLLGSESTTRQRAALGKAVLENFFEAVLDFGRNRRLTLAQLNARIENVEGIDRYEQVRALERGAILVTAHLGPFETAVAGLRSREQRVHVLFQRDQFPRFEQLRTEQRRRLGVIEAPVDDGMATWIKLRDALLNNEVVLVQGDRIMPGQKGVRVPFLDGHVELPDGPAKLAQLTGAPIVPVFAILTPRRTVRILIDQPLLVGGSGQSQVTQDQAITGMAATIAGVVRKYPDQWLVLEKMWLEDRSDSTDSCSPTRP